ncbi:unnamed protein product [Zymoseptoria tritici ST99CH_3D1]|nr:unnamed protein product [Zymoseptoria tritici ST99CH_3D1]
MFRQLALTTALLSMTLWQRAVAVDETRQPEKIAQLDTAATQLDRLKILPNNEDWVFDFTAQQPWYNWSPGGVTNMNAATFPAARGNGLTLAMLNLGGCSILPAHFHPRASNYVVSIEGNTTTYMYEENGAHTITAVLTKGKATIFPAGSMHTMVNNGCENAQLVSALSSEDAGTLNIGAVFTNGFPPELVNAALGGAYASPEFAAKIPPIGTGANYGTEECRQRCGIKTDGSYQGGPPQSANEKSGNKG